MIIAPQLRIYVSFFFFAFTTGAMMARLPDLQLSLGVTKGELGLTLIGMAIGSLISLTLSTPLIVRLGARRTALITVLGTAVCFALVPWMPSALWLFALLFACGLLAGALEINLNVETDRLEAQLGKRFMNRAHGTWSLGFFTAALVGALVRQLGMSVPLHLALTSGLALVVAGTLLYNLVPAAPRRDGNQQTVPSIALPTWGLMPLCIIGIAAFLAEGGSIDWSAIYMRDVFDAPPFVGGLGLALFALSMALARLTIDPVVARFGPRRVATTLLSVAATGAFMVGVAPAYWVALAGFACLGIGCSALYPLAISAAAQRTDRPAAVNVAALGQVTFVVFFLAPPLLGFIAQYAGIRYSYLIMLPVIALGLLASRALPTQIGVTPPRADLASEISHL